MSLTPDSIAALKSKIISLQNSIIPIQASNELLNQQIQSLQTSVDQNQMQIDTINSCIVEIQKDINN